MGLDRKRVGLAASNFSAEELQGQAMQAIAALLLHHKLTINTICEGLVEGAPEARELAKELLKWHEDYVSLKQAGDLINGICPHYQSPSKEAIDRAIENMRD